MYHVGTIIRKKLASPTVMVLDLKVPSLASFQPGQWVDFVVPPHPWIGGFSISSSPKDLPKLTLAIKKSSHAPATWVHEVAQINQEVQIQVGGSCVLPPIDSTAKDSFLSSPPRIFCAGGIGISPILSQYREFLSQRASCATPTASGPATRFLYTVSQQAELVFAEELVTLFSDTKRYNSSDHMVFSLTQASDWDVDPSMHLGAVELKLGRVMKQFLDEVPKSAIFFLCGPPTMLEDAVTYLMEVRGVEAANIHYERWW